MTNLMRAALAALVLAASHLAPAPALAQTGDRPVVLPTQRARPPVRATPTPAAAAPSQQRPGRPPAVRRPRVPPAAQRDTAPSAGPLRERWADISVQTANSGTYHLPVGRGNSGPSVLRVQVLLSRALFSTGMMDGYWGHNTQTAVQFFQSREGLPATGVVDSATYVHLVRVAGDSQTVVPQVLTADDVAGPFVRMPDDIYAQARLSCSCFESLSEKLTERFHTRVEVLRKLNPGVALDSLAAGDTLFVPAVRPAEARAPGEIRQLVVSGAGKYVQALDANGRILYHFSATLGSTFDPSPQGDFTVTSIHENPWWHYQPKLLAHVPDDRPNARIPPGPNSAVGRVWMSLSAPHYGIHGTKSPETIGYAQSAGCVRLTNWDALFLSKRLAPGTPVTFSDTPRPGAGQPADARRPVIGTRADSARTDSAARPTPAARDTVRRAPPAPRDTARSTAPAPRDTARSSTTAPPRATATPRSTSPASSPAPAPQTPPRPVAPAARDTTRASQPAARP
ncbi:L,D-transpeptidase family protein [Longimicrobium sp.]|jgi:lipoprotein-anchoring transpeptidase ErfK/SrfK|uniref:L,D-transpeptidase family protein n=1 Tax=Longimicrobium sp. TaxID=2029185 RepID=UPI002EDA78D7